jgi:NAD(P)-dependent dehydrogenase (short-subunit alcohol dehydrogenase family)
MVGCTARIAVARHRQLDVLRNNAGVLGWQVVIILSLDAVEFERVPRQRAGSLPWHKACYGGSIVSVAGVMGGMAPHVYMVSKHALVGLTKNVACELERHDVNVTTSPPSSLFVWLVADSWC